MMEHKHKTIVKKVIKQSGAKLGFFIRSRRPHARILTYHSIGFREHEMNVMPDRFADQMTWLASHAPVIPLDQAIHGEPGVALTFDDGYRDNLIHAAPVLKSLGLPATVFIVAGRVGKLLDHDRGLSARAAALLSWDEIRSLDAEGIQIGAHTMHHVRLSQVSLEQQAMEITESKTVLEQELGHPVTAFAYPFGASSDYNEESVRLVQQAGFAYAVSNRYGVHRPTDDIWTVRRIWIDNSDDFAMFKAKVTGRLDVLTWLDSPLGLSARRYLNRSRK